MSMRVCVSQEPSRDAAMHIGSLMRNTNIHTLVLLSGGSALEVLEHVDPEVLGPHLTLQMADERCSDIQIANNFFKLVQTKFYKEALNRGVHITSSTSKENDNERACSEIQTNLENGFNTFVATYAPHDRNIVALLGAGADGHTASIFPTQDIEKFNQTYYDKKHTYTCVTVHENEYKDRVTITLSALEEYVHEIIFYVVGDTKHDIVSRIITFRDEAPAHVLPAAAITQLPNVSFYTDSSVKSEE